MAHSTITPTDAEYAEVAASVVRYDYDPRRAIQLIEGLGYVRASDGMFRDGSNQRVIVEFRAPAFDVLRKTQHAAADYWQTVGVGVTVVELSPLRRGDQEYQATFLGFDIHRGNAGAENFRTFHSTEARTPQNRYFGQNVPNYMNPEFDALLERYLVTIPRAERMRAAGQIVHHMTDQLIMLNQFYDATPTIASGRLRNVSMNLARGATITWNAHDWDVAR